MEDKDEKTIAEPEDAESENEEPETDGETDGEDDDAETDGETDGEDDDAEAEEEEGEEDGEEGDAENLGKRAEKRIQKLVGQRKDAERRVKELEHEIEEMRKTAGDDGELYVEAARAANVLPSLMTRDQAQGLKALAEKERSLEAVSTLLDGDDDEFELGGETYSRRQVERREARLRKEVEDLKERHGGARKEIQKKAREIFELGMKAMKAGWKPGAKTETGKRKTIDKPVPKKPAKCEQRAKRGDVDWSNAGNSDEDLEAAISAMRGK